MATASHNYFVPDIGNFFDSFLLIFDTHISTFSMLIAVTPFFTIIPTVAYFHKLLRLVNQEHEIARRVDPYKINLGLCLAVDKFGSNRRSTSSSALIQTCWT